MKLIAQMKLAPTPVQAASLEATMREVNAASEWLSAQAWEAQTFHRYSLHRLGYHGVRERFNVSGAMTTKAVVNRVADAYRTGKRCVRHFRPLGAVRHDCTTARIGETSVDIWTVDGRETVPFVCGELQHAMLQGKRGGSVLTLRDGTFYLHVACEAETPDTFDPTDWLGVDLGVVNIATDSDGDCHTGADLKGVRHRRARIRGRLQSKGTRSAKRRLRQQSGRERRHATDVNHCISKRIVREAERTGRGIALEDLKGIRDRIRARRSQRRTLHSWAFHQLREFIEYKAALAGVPVVTVDPAYTSRTCPSCGSCAKANRPTRNDFRCAQCGLAGPADHIAARNIAGRAAAVQPHAAPACG